jgi:hypothetical protein
MLFKAFISEAFPLIKPALNNRWFKKNYEYPKVTHNSSGLPTIRTYSYDTPYQISDLFAAWGGKADVDLPSMHVYNELVNYLLHHEKHIETAYPERLEEPNSSQVFKTITTVFIQGILERYFHLSRSDHFEPSVFESIYKEIENYLYNTDLYFDIGVPILFLRFDFDVLVIDENILIRRIPDEHHKARFGIRGFGPPISDSVISSATHELVFKNHFIKRGKRLFDNTLSFESAYPIEDFESFFNAIKLVCNHSSGFAQILVHPHNWADLYHVDLPVLHGLSTRRYPAYFDDYYWNQDSFPLITSEEAERVGHLFIKLLTNTHNKIAIAGRRFRSSYLRDNENDSIIDIIIALEILLSDSEKGEITHKLALRVAKLISVHNSHYDALQVFDAVKKIYAFRSALVHGSSVSKTKREIKLHETAMPISTISLANDFLREIIKIAVEHPNFLTAKEVDRLLLY